MALKYGEIGKGIYVDASYDLNAAPFTELTLTFTRGDQSFTRTTADGVTAPAVDSPALPANPSSGFPGGVLPANTYVLYTTGAPDWDVAAFDEAATYPDDWQVCLTYEDAAPTKLFGDHSILQIEEGC